MPVRREIAEARRQPAGEVERPLYDPDAKNEYRNEF